jgi:hypothetical protein
LQALVPLHLMTQPAASTLFAQLFFIQFSEDIMKKLLILGIIALHCAQASVGMNWSSDNPNCINDALQTHGFLEISNKQFLKSDYNNLYKNYDHFINVMKTNLELSEIMFQSEEDFFLIEEQGKRYCSAPPSYRDPDLARFFDPLSSRGFDLVNFERA